MTWVTYQPGHTAVVLDSPHSGTRYPQDFGHSCDFMALRRAEDTHVERLFEFASDLGAAWVEAHFPRSYLDANRDTTEIDEALLADGPWPGPIELGPKVRLGKGLIWRLTDDGQPIYQRQLTVAEVHNRIQCCWTPYHRAVAEAVHAAHLRHGFCLHINCHSMPAVASSHATEFPGLAHADVVLGNRDGTTASPALLDLMATHLRGLGYDVACNHPYKGVELVRRHGCPGEHRHSVQLEINRRLYMDEVTLEIHQGFAPLRADLRTLVQRLLNTDARAL